MHGPSDRDGMGEMCHAWKHKLNLANREKEIEIKKNYKDSGFQRKARESMGTYLDFKSMMKW